MDKKYNIDELKIIPFLNDFWVIKDGEVIWPNDIIGYEKTTDISLFDTYNLSDYYEEITQYALIEWLENNIENIKPTITQSVKFTASHAKNKDLRIRFSDFPFIKNFSWRNVGSVTLYDLPQSDNEFKEKVRYYLKNEYEIYKTIETKKRFEQDLF